MKDSKLKLSRRQSIKIVAVTAAATAISCRGDQAPVPPSKKYLEATDLTGLQDTDPLIYEQEKVLNGKSIEGAQKIDVGNEGPLFTGKDSSIIQVVPASQENIESKSISLEIKIDELKKGTKQVVRQVGDSGRVELGIALEDNAPVFTARLINGNGDLKKRRLRTNFTLEPERFYRIVATVTKNSLEVAVDDEVIETKTYKKDFSFAKGELTQIMGGLGVTSMFKPQFLKAKSFQGELRELVISSN